MKGSVFVLLACFALFIAAPSHSYSISEDDRLANRRDTQSGSRSTDAATSGDAVENTDTSAGESRAVEMDGDADPGDEAGDARAEKSKLRKRDTRSLVGDETETHMVAEPTVDKKTALYIFRALGKYGGKCFERAFDYINEHEVPTEFTETWYPQEIFTRPIMIKWLEIIKDTVSECLMAEVNQMNSIYSTHDYEMAVPEPDDFVYSDFFSLLTDIGKMMKKCFEDTIRYLKATYLGPGDAVQRSSESFTDLLTELIEILSIIDGTAVPAGDTVPVFPPGHTVSPYPDAVPAIATYKRHSLDKPRGYRHYSNLPGFLHPPYVYTKDITDSIVPQFSGFRGEAVQIPYTPGITTLPEDVNALPTQQLSLLNVVLHKIYSKLQREVSPAGNMEAAPVEGLRVDENGVLGVYRGHGESPATGNLEFEPECAHKRVQ